MKKIAERASRFGTITILKAARTGAVVYSQGGYYQSQADRNGVSLLHYIHAIFGLLDQAQAQSVLMIGCAGGSLATMLAIAGCRPTVLDVNPHAYELARRYFHLPATVECRLADGAEFLYATRRKFDAIVLDAFHGDYIPEHLRSAAFFETVRKRLARNGSLFANVHVRHDLDAAADGMAAAMAEVWPHVRILDRQGRRFRNAIVMAGAVSGLRRPKLVLTPEVEAREIAAELGEMHFRKRRRL